MYPRVRFFIRLAFQTRTTDVRDSSKWALEKEMEVDFVVCHVLAVLITEKKMQALGGSQLVNQPNKNIMDGTKRGNINRIPPVELHSSSVELASTKQR